jgi:transcriptional regulator with XRE-family HTH domain
MTAPARRRRGAASARIADNVRDVRKSRGMSTYDVSRALAGLGWPIAQSGIARVESGDRAVTVDDLLALAAALGCSPNRLLLPEVGDAATETLIGGITAAPDEMWGWARGEHPLAIANGQAVAMRRGVAAAVFATENRQDLLPADLTAS